MITLAIDIGGSGVKAALLDHEGAFLSERVRIDTPYPCPPSRLIETLAEISTHLPGFHRVAVGFPGLVRDGHVSFIASLSRASLEGETDPELVALWRGYPLRDVLIDLFKAPVRVENDADVQGSAVIRGQGMEFVLTLGTGVGTALFFNGILLPHLEIGHAPFRKGNTFEEQLGNVARKSVGRERWIQRVHLAIPAFDRFLFFDHMFIGGGNGRLLVDEVLPENVTLVSNKAGILGGIKIWNS
ncbi:MAG: ROK family protein [Actinobacteria bacterium]|nr:ROK family protein [Actinomycetota bacterium]